MALYPATTSLDDLVPSNPTSAEDAGKTDDALRETRTVLKNVLSLIHTATGGLRIASFRERIGTPAGNNPAPAGVDTWQNKTSFTRTINIGAVDTAIIAGQFKPVAGTYLVYGFCVGFQINRTQCRLYNATDSAPVAGSYGSVAFSANNAGGDLGSEAKSEFCFPLTTDGTKVFILQQIHQTNNTANGWGVGTRAAGQWVTTENNFSQITFLKIG